MSQLPTANRRVVLAARPRGRPSLHDFRLEEVPLVQPAEGQVLLRTLYLSLDPYIILDHYADRFDAFRRDMSAWIAEGRIALREHRIEGLENAPAALIGLLEGHNFGKVVVRVVGEPTP